MLVASAAPPFPPRSFASLRKGCQPAGIALPTAVTRVRATHHRSRTLGIKTIMPGVARATSFKRSVRRTSPCHTARQRSGVSSSRHTTPAPSVPQSPNPPQPLARFSRARRALPCVGPRRVTWPFHFIHGTDPPYNCALRASARVNVTRPRTRASLFILFLYQPTVSQTYMQMELFFSS